MSGLLNARQARERETLRRLAKLVQQDPRVENVQARLCGVLGWDLMTEDALCRHLADALAEYAREPDEARNDG